ncbi:uncharacterized protein cubi_03755 [Cryptosporidium ubiquitum]|uniref:Uncharacterized protein n=1 Tax=Cryptosporidium ubiquitum TaxID=857276 RepID=A0A1J4MQJ5_9CRYT|nr:uncharacterized protein cubi_03755 [Cryptosporidium ubiquitum]OII75276.1 hypothetical protein cubi_03755 [Cryptosporidium ubiquitum]
MFKKTLASIILILIFIISQAQGKNNDISSLISNLVSKYMTKEEFLNECRKDLPKYRSNLTEIQVYFLCLRALRSSLDSIYKSPVGKLLNSDSVPKEVVEHKNENIEGYRKLLDDVSNIFSSDVFFDEDLLEADNGLFSNSIQAIIEADKREIRRKELIEKKAKEIQTADEKLREEYRRKLEKKYPEAYHPLALEILSTISEEDIKFWMNLPVKLKLPVLNYYFLLVATRNQISEKRDRHKIFTEAILSTIISKNTIVIPKYMTLQDIRYEICKLGVLYKFGCKIAPFSILLSLPRHSFKIWKSFGLVLQFELLIAMTYSIDHKMNFDDCSEEIFKITKKNKLGKEDETKIRVYLLHSFPEEDSIPMKHFKSALGYLLDTAIDNKPSKSDNKKHPYSITYSNYEKVKSEETFSITSNKTESEKEDNKKSKIESEINDRSENKEEKVFPPFEKKETNLTTESDTIETQNNEYPPTDVYSGSKNNTDNILDIIKSTEVKEIKENNGGKDTENNQIDEEFNLMSLVNSQTKTRDAKITIRSEQSNGLKKINVEGLSNLPHKEYNPYSNVGIGPTLMHIEEEDEPSPDEKEAFALDDESNNGSEENGGAEDQEAQNIENVDNDETLNAEELENKTGEDDLNTKENNTDEGDSRDREEKDMDVDEGEKKDENVDKDYPDINGQDGNNKEHTLDDLDKGDNDEENLDIRGTLEGEDEGDNKGERDSDLGNGLEIGGNKYDDKDSDSGGDRGDHEEESDSGGNQHFGEEGGEDLDHEKDSDIGGGIGGFGMGGGDDKDDEEGDSDSGDNRNFGAEGEEDLDHEKDSDLGGGVGDLGIGGGGDKDDEEGDSDSAGNGNFGAEGEEDLDHEKDSDIGGGIGGFGIGGGGDKDDEEGDSDSAGNRSFGEEGKEDLDHEKDSDIGGGIGGFGMRVGGDRDDEEEDSDSGDNRNFGAEGGEDLDHEKDSDIGGGIGGFGMGDGENKDDEEESDSAGNRNFGAEGEEDLDHEKDSDSGGDRGDHEEESDFGGNKHFGTYGGEDLDQEKDSDLGGGKEDSEKEEGGFDFEDDKHLGTHGGEGLDHEKDSDLGGGIGDFGMRGGENKDDEEGDSDSGDNRNFGAEGRGDFDHEKDSDLGGFGVENESDNDNKGPTLEVDLGMEDLGDDKFKGGSSLKDAADFEIGDDNNSNFGKGTGFEIGGKSKSEYNDSSFVHDTDMRGQFEKENFSFETEKDDLNSQDSAPVGNIGLKDAETVDTDESDIGLEKGINSMLGDRAENYKDDNDLDSNFKNLDMPIGNSGNSEIVSKDNFEGGEENEILARSSGFNGVDMTGEIPSKELGLGEQYFDGSGGLRTDGELDFGNEKDMENLDQTLRDLNNELEGFNSDRTGINDAFESERDRKNNIGMNEILRGEDLKNGDGFEQRNVNNEINNLLNEFEKGNDLSDGDSYNELGNIIGEEATDLKPKETTRFLDSLIKPDETGIEDIETNPLNNNDSGITISGLEFGGDIGSQSFDNKSNPNLVEIDSNIPRGMAENEIDAELDTLGDFRASNVDIDINPNDGFGIQDNKMEEDLAELEKLGEQGTGTTGIHAEFPDNSIDQKPEHLNDEFRILEELGGDDSIEEDEFAFLERLVNEKNNNKNYDFASTVDSEEFMDDDNEYNDFDLPDGHINDKKEFNSQIDLNTQDQVLEEIYKPMISNDHSNLKIDSIPVIKDNSIMGISGDFIRDQDDPNSPYEEIDDIIDDLEQKGFFPIEAQEINTIDTAKSDSGQLTDAYINKIYSDLKEKDGSLTDISIQDSDSNIYLTKNNGKIKDHTDEIGNLDVLTEDKILDQNDEEDFGLKEMFMENDLDKNFRESEFIPFLDELQRGNGMLENQNVSIDTADKELIDLGIFDMNTENESNKYNIVMETDPEESINILFENEDQHQPMIKNEVSLGTLDILPEISVKAEEVDSVLSSMIIDKGLNVDLSSDELGLGFDAQVKNNQEKDLQDDYTGISDFFNEPGANLENNNIEGPFQFGMLEDGGGQNNVKSQEDEEDLYLDMLFRTGEEKSTGIDKNVSVISFDHPINNEEIGRSDEDIDLSEIGWLNEGSAKNDEKMEETNSVINDLNKLVGINEVEFVDNEEEQMFLDELIKKNTNENKDLNYYDDFDDLRLDEFFEKEVNLNQFNTESENRGEIDISGITPVKKKDKSIQEYTISSEDLDFLYKQSEEYLSRSFNKQKIDSISDDSEFLDSDMFINEGNQFKKSTLIKLNNSDPNDVELEKNSKLIPGTGRRKEEEKAQEHLKKKKMLRGASSEEDKEIKSTNRSLGTILEKKKQDSEKEWIMSFAPKLRPGRMKRRRDLFTQEEIDQAIKDAQKA